MKWQAAFLAALLLAAVGTFGCSRGGGSTKSTPSSSDATFQAALGDAAKTPVSESVRAYARQLCPPIKAFLHDAGDTLSKLNETSTPPATQSLDAVFSQAFGLFGDLKGPFKDLRDSLKDIDPPDDLKSYHQALIAEMDYTVRAIDALSSGGLVGALALPAQEPTPQSPPGFEAALLQECGDDLKPFADQLGGLFGGGSAATPTATPPPPGVVGLAVRSGDYELLVNSVVDPYTSSDEFSQPDAGNRYVVLDVSITNVSSDTKDYNSYDFKLRDRDNFQYDSTYSDVQQALSSGSLLAGETIRGKVSFQVPQSARLTRLVFEPNFGFSGGRIDIALP